MKKNNYFTTKESVCAYLKKYNFKYVIPDLRRNQRYCVKLNDKLDGVNFCSVESVANNVVFYIQPFYDCDKAYKFTKAKTNYEIIEDSFNKIGITIDGKSVIDGINKYFYESTIGDGEYTFKEEDISDLKEPGLYYTISVKHIKNGEDEYTQLICLQDINYNGESLLCTKLYL